MKILMIGGTGRCGTTILKTIFSKHKDMAVVPEWRFLIDPDGLLDFYNTISTCWSPYLYDVKLSRLKKMLTDIGKNNLVGAGFSYLLRHLDIINSLPLRLSPSYSEVVYVKKYCPEYQNYVQKLIDKLTQFKYIGQNFQKKLLSRNELHYGFFRSEDLIKIIRDFYYQIIRCVKDSLGKKYYLEKNTFNILWFDKILELLPESKLIHIYRDPRDVVSSFIQQPWSPTDPSQAALFYKDIINTWWNIRSKIPSHSFYEIPLESLVNNKEKNLRKLCEFMGIPWDDNLLDVDLSKSNKGRWRKNLSKADQKKIQNILSNELNELGYK